MQPSAIFILSMLDGCIVYDGNEKRIKFSIIPNLIPFSIIEFLSKFNLPYFTPLAPNPDVPRTVGDNSFTSSN